LRTRLSDPVFLAAALPEIVEQFQRHRQLSGRPRSVEMDAAAGITGKPTPAATAPTAASVDQRIAVAGAKIAKQGATLADMSTRVDKLLAGALALKPTTAAARPPASTRTAPSRPTPAAPSPLADYSNSKLAWLATHPSATASDKANARAELARRGTTITPSGIVSQSTRRQPRK
jgi:hypothetical protein